MKKPYYETANMYKYLASIINTLNHDETVDKVKSTTHKIQKMLEKMNARGGGRAVIDDAAELERH